MVNCGYRKSRGGLHHLFVGCYSGELQLTPKLDGIKILQVTVRAQAVAVRTQSEQTLVHFEVRRI